MNDFIQRHANKWRLSGGGCWEWIAAEDGYGYGAVYHRRKVTKAHRAFYIELIGDIPAGMDLCHKCDNRKCVNPEHMFVGTRKQNMEDCVRKGRFPRRDASHKAKITKKIADSIRSDNRKYREIAEEHGVSLALISAIKTKGHWA